MSASRNGVLNNIHKSTLQLIQCKRAKYLQNAKVANHSDFGLNLHTSNVENSNRFINSTIIIINVIDYL